MDDVLDKALNNEKNNSIIKLNTSKIDKIKNKILDELNITNQYKNILLDKLKYYRHVDELPDIEFGNYIRWIPIKKGVSEIKLTNGGLIIGIEIFDNGIHIKCKNNMNRIFQIKLDECLVFQKLTDQEEILLKVVDYLER
tara:strand:- start:64 stop:483 length:420 start_codon:yes stop_codon:yes gene_type:complete